MKDLVKAIGAFDLSANNGQGGNPTLPTLSAFLYSELHCRTSVAERLITPRERRMEQRDFLSLVSNANSGVGPWHEGWVVRHIGKDGRLCVQHDGLRLWASMEEFRASPVMVGTSGALKFPKEYRYLYPGHYVALGDHHPGHSNDTIRLYWNVTAAGAAPLMESVTKALNDARIAFQLKLLSDPEGYYRADAAILYVPRNDWKSCHKRIARIYSTLRSYLRPLVSAYVLELAPGLGLAEDPGGESAISFGEHRSDLLAAAILAAGEADRHSAIEQFVHRAGFDLERFYVNPGSVHRYFVL